jgi:hypothetical protein
MTPSKPLTFATLLTGETMNIAWRIASFLAVTVFCVTTASPVGADNPPGPTSIEDLDKLPIGLKVTHYPNPCLATETEVKAGSALLQYTWWFKTSVSPTDSDVKLTEFGAYGWQDGRWVFANFTRKPFSSKDFADWYSCPDAALKKGTIYSDPKNWATSSVLRAGKARWYYVGLDANGRRVKGDAVIEEKGEVDPAKPGDSSADASGGASRAYRERIGLGAGAAAEDPWRLARRALFLR